MTKMQKVDQFQGERLKESPFHSRQSELNLRDAWSSWNGYKFAEYYYDAEFEYFCIRNSCGTYDITPMQKYIVTGKNAEKMLNRMVTRDITKLKLNKVTYVCWCTDEGRLIDDGTIFKLSSNKFMLTCGSPSLAWLKKSCIGIDEVKVHDYSDLLAALSVQGPTSCEILKTMGIESIENLKPFSVLITTLPGLDNVPLMVSRTGFTGDLGYELWIDFDHALEFWDALYTAGENFGIQPYGEEATNMARLEAGFLMPGMEFNEALKTVNFQYDQTPFDLSLDWLVDFKKPHFNGKNALLKIANQGSEYKLIKLDIEGNKPANESFLYSDKRCSKEIGYVTSAMWSPVVKANIALAMVKTKHITGNIWAEIYYSRELRHQSKVARCEVRNRPFWAPDRAKVTPPGPS